jgi:hypothetical protein
MKKIAPFIVMASIVLLSCTSNTIDDLVPIIEDNEPEVVTYEDVESIFIDNCLRCHSNPPQNGAPMQLTSYNDVMNAVLNRGLIDRISRNDGETGLMPFGGPRLSQQRIDLIVQWNEDGLLEN